MSDVYQPPEHGWTCFHCGETFKSVGSARDHFGGLQTSEPGCMIKVSLGAERGLLMALRKAEEALARYADEDTDMHRDFSKKQSQQSENMRLAEEAGYERGLKAGKIYYEVEKFL